MDALQQVLQAVDHWLTPDRVAMLYYIYNAAVQSLPGPEGSGKGYRFFYGLMHTLAGNTGLVRKQLKGTSGEPDLAQMQAQMDELRKLVESAIEATAKPAPPAG